MSWDIPENKRIKKNHQHFYHHNNGAFPTQTEETSRYSLFWIVTQRKLIVTDVSGKPIGQNLKDQVVQRRRGSRIYLFCYY